MSHYQRKYFNGELFSNYGILYAVCTGIIHGKLYVRVEFSLFIYSNSPTQWSDYNEICTIRKPSTVLWLFYLVKGYNYLRFMVNLHGSFPVYRIDHYIFSPLDVISWGFDFVLLNREFLITNSSRLISFLGTVGNNTTLLLFWFVVLLF